MLSFHDMCTQNRDHKIISAVSTICTYRLWLITILRPNAQPSTGKRSNSQLSQSIRETSMKLCSTHSYYRRNLCVKNKKLMKNCKSELSPIIIIKGSAQGKVLHSKRRNLKCSYAEGRYSTANSGTKTAVLSGTNRCGSFPFLSTPHCL